MDSLSREEILRYSRHLIMPEVTLEGQLRLKRARVLCVGAGGLGSPLALYLAAAGVGTLGLVEFDAVDLTNLQRQVLYDTRDLGRPKLDAALARLTALNPDIRIVPHPVRLDSTNVLDIVRAYDVVADGTDNFPTRYLVNDACVLAGRPNVYGSIFRFDGQVSVFAARRGPCYRCLFPEPPPPGLVPSCAEGGVLGVLPGIVGTLQALEVLKLILEKGEPLVGRLVLFDSLGFRFTELAVAKDPACAVCGEAPTITAPIDYEAFCGVSAEGAAPLHAEGAAPLHVEGAAPLHVEGAAPSAPSATAASSSLAVGSAPALLSVEALRDRRAAGEAVTVLDVREPHEFAIARIPGATPFPLSALPARLHELDSTQAYTISCHRGTRSVQAYHLLRAAGFERLRVLDGGVDAWAARIDPEMARY